jgi:hypothetical protein
MLMDMDNPICDVILNSLGNYVAMSTLHYSFKNYFYQSQIGRMVVVPCKIS